MIVKECKQCGEEFKTYPSVDSKFCSKRCHYDSKKGKPIPWLDDIRKPGVCLNTGRTHFKKGERPSPETEFSDGHEPWNKEGHNVYSKETLQKMSKAHRGQRVSKETEFKKGHTAWNKGLKGFDPSPGTHFKSEDVSGANNHNWKGGISDEYHKIKQSKEYKEWRSAVYERDHFTCQKCGDGKNIIAHHIESFADNPNKRFEVDNGVVLCRSCHAKFHNQYGFGDNNKSQFNKFTEIS